MKKILFGLIVSVLAFAVLFLLIEITFKFTLFRHGTVYQQIYEALQQPGNQVGYISQPYLNYINRPGYRDSRGNTEINSMGLRYSREVPLQKDSGTCRILFLGGSTTFGDVDDTFEMFPALIEKALPQEPCVMKKFRSIECLNGGVHGLTSAELLAHFQYKYQYLQPDIVVLHTGFNDAFMYARINQAPYQPDYHNSRRVFRDVLELKPWERKMLWSRTAVYLLVNLRLRDYLKTSLEDNAFFHYTGQYLWFPDNPELHRDTTYNAFFQNMKTLTHVAASRGSVVLFVPEVCDTTKMPAHLRLPLLRGLMLHRAMMQQLAVNHYIRCRLLPDSIFTPNLFLEEDGIHVNAQGEKLKAHYIADFIKAIICSDEQ
ncbi:MAG: SGNH/GDSL hydrolase family protein [Chitinophagales bacterium]|nr:SGNH/GDSL hydrolase family protein [Chitinophagales bacterium]MDW8417799.1 SGNH/GDSL hydrolase family protein [Chitinophagales bacterium]